MVSCVVVSSMVPHLGIVQYLDDTTSEPVHVLEKVSRLVGAQSREPLAQRRLIMLNNAHTDLISPHSCATGDRFCREDASACNG